MLHPIKKWRALRRRTKVIVSGVSGFVLIPALAIAAVLLLSSSPFQGGVKNGAWSATVTTAAIVPDTDAGDGAPGQIALPTDTPAAVQTALGNPGTYIANDTSEKYACQGVSVSGGIITWNAGTGALPGDTCYMDLTVNVPASNAAKTWVAGLDVTGLPTGWVMLIDGQQGGATPSLCGGDDTNFLPAGTTADHVRVLLVAGANVNRSVTTEQDFTGHIKFEGNRVKPTDVTSADCFVVGS